MHPVSPELGALVLAWALVACEEPRSAGPTTAPVASEQSPNASILPAPLASTRGADPKRAAAHPANLPPRAFPHDRELLSDPNPDHDIGGVELRAEFVWAGVDARDVPLEKAAAPVVDTPRPSSKGDAARPEAKSEPATLSTLPTLRIRITQNGRMFTSLASPTFTLPPGTELQSRVDRWGHVVVWPDGRSYRVAPRGSLRALFEERRVDVAPLLDGDAVPDGGGQRFDLPTVRRKINGPLGEVLVESAVDTNFGASGTLLCRLLLELSRLDPASDLCPAGELPVEATYKWPGQGELRFRVTALKHVPSFAAAGVTADLSIPPSMPIFKPGELPPETTTELWPPAQSRVLLGAPERSQAEVILANPGDLPLFVIFDRLPLVRVDSGTTARFAAPPRPRSVAFRDFLGERIEPPRNVDVPGKLALAPEPEPTPSEGEEQRADDLARSPMPPAPSGAPPVATPKP